MNKVQLDHVLRLHGLIKVTKDKGFMIVRYAGTAREPWWVFDIRRDGGFVQENSTHRIDVVITMIEKFIRDVSYGPLVSVAHNPLGSLKWFPVQIDLDEVHGYHLQPMSEDPDAREVSGAARLLSDVDIEAVLIALAVVVLIILVLRLIMRV